MSCKRKHRHEQATAVAMSPRLSQAQLPASVIEAMDLALADKRQAHRTYTEVLERFGDVRPFSNIVQAEARHIEALLRLYEEYGATVPDDQSIADPDIAVLDLKALCEKGVAAEVENVRLYDEQLIPAVSTYAAITTVFLNLRNASADRHLPAFRRCAQRDGRLGRGQRRNRS